MKWWIYLATLLIVMLGACSQKPDAKQPTLETQGRLTFRGADPSVIRVGSTFYAVDSVDRNIYIRSSSTVDGLGTAARRVVWSSNLGNVWAPELVRDPVTGRFYIFFAPGVADQKRMYVVESVSPDSSYGSERRMSLPDDKWAIDGASFVYNSQRWFVWSGWEGNSNVEQTLYVARMNSATTTTGPRYVISQPRESWERVVGNPFINEGPEPIIDPSGQLHIVYSANGSWSDQYCLADLRLRAGGDPANVWDWYKSNGCLFGSNRTTLMSGWDPTLYANGPGHHSFVLLNGDPNTSPPAGQRFPLMYHAVAKGTPYAWENRYWYSGTFAWWGNTTYTRGPGNGDTSNTGWSLKLFE